MPKLQERSKTVSWKDYRVTIRPRGDGRWVIYWREAGRGKSTTALTEKAAEDEALRIAKRVQPGTGGRVLSVEDAQIVEHVKRLAGARPAFAWLREIEDCQQRLKGATIPQATAHYISAGYLSVRHISFTDAKAQFIGTYGTKKKHSKYGPQQELNGWDRAHPGAMLGEVDKDGLVTWISRPLKKSGEDPSPQTYKNRLKSWKTFLNWCQKPEKKYLPAGEAHAAALIEAQPIPRGTVAIWEPEVARAILAILPELLQPYLIIGCWLGLRPSEILRLDWEAFDWRRNYLFVSEAVAQKAGGDRYVPIGPLAKSLLAPWVGSKGRCCPKKADVQVSKLARAAKIIEKWEVDVMRHSYISYRIACGVSRAQVAEESGNSEKIIKQHYRRPLRKEDGEEWFQLPWPHAQMTHQFRMSKRYDTLHSHFEEGALDVARQRKQS